MQRAPAILTGALLCLAAASAQAQYQQQQQEFDEPSRRPALWLKGGASWGDVSNRGLLPGDLSGRMGFAAGLGIGPIGEPIGIGIEGLYAQRGVSSDVPGSSAELDYLDIPVYLRITIPTDAVSPFLYAGPQFSVELHCEDGVGECVDTDRSELSYYANIGAGIAFGGSTALSIEARYLYGLSDLRLGTITESESYRSRSFLLMGGIGF
jgi:hypothetical protein